MDAFFASVELLDHPGAASASPSSSGIRSLRSVVTAATYEARKFGVNSAMPMAVALRRCPQAIVLEPHYERYTHWSGDRDGPVRRRHPVRRGARHRRGVPRRRGRAPPAGHALADRHPLRERVFAETGLRCSVGAAATKYVAKLASSRAKPDGLLVVPEADDPRVPASAADLGALGRRGQDRRGAAAPRAAHRRRRREHPGRHADAGRSATARRDAPPRAGLGSRSRAVIVTERVEKSVGHETTFETTMADLVGAEREMLRPGGCRRGATASGRGCGAHGRAQTAFRATSRRSRGRAPSRNPPTSAGASTRRRGRSTPAGPAGRPVRLHRGARRTARRGGSRAWGSGTTTSTGATPSTPSTRSAPSSAAAPCGLRRC